MFKMPEPEITLAWDSWAENWEARDHKHCLARKEDDRIIGYSEAQLNQVRREALEEAKTALLKEPTQLITRWKIAEIIEEVKEGL